MRELLRDGRRRTRPRRYWYCWRRYGGRSVRLGNRGFFGSEMDTGTASWTYTLETMYFSLAYLDIIYLPTVHYYIDIISLRIFVV